MRIPKRLSETGLVKPILSYFMLLMVKIMKKIECKNCNAEFNERIVNSNRGWGVFCSKSCSAFFREREKRLKAPPPPVLTQQTLKEHLHYEANTGIFTWIKPSAHCVNVGDIAGTNSNGYVSIFIFSKQYKAHRLAWLYVCGEWPKDQIDHINGNRSDNRFGNLREATNAENQQNSSIYKNNKSGFKGVSWKKKEKKWVAQGQLNGRRKYLGAFNTPEEASEVFEAFTKEQYGEFYRACTKVSQ